jgi:hypothetical protein
MPRGAGGLVSGVAVEKLSVGQRIEVEWPEDNAWYPGEITVSGWSVL